MTDIIPASHMLILCFFFFSSRRRHTRLQGDWSSDVCSSDLPRGAAYFTGDPVRTALIPAEGTPLPDGDPTGCGDVLGATVAASLIAGAGLEAALRLGTRMAARNVSHRGASGLRDHLLGRLSAV